MSDDTAQPVDGVPETWDQDDLMLRHALRCVRCRRWLRRWQQRQRRMRPGDPGE